MPEFLFKKVKACNSIKKKTLAKVFSIEFCEISKNTFVQNTSGRLLICISLITILKPTSVWRDTSTFVMRTLKTGKNVFFQVTSQKQQKQTKKQTKKITKLQWQKNLNKSHIIKVLLKRVSNTGVFQWILRNF